jgi:isocitrate dehydrogenase (NAD+)
VTPASQVLVDPKRRVSQHASLPKACYGGWHTVTLIPGDGVGPELMQHVKEVFRYAGVPVDFEEVQLNSTVTEDEDIDNALLAIKRNGVALKGNLITKLDPGFKSRNVELRSELDLYANVVHCKSIPGVPTRHQDINIVIIRENTEGEYSQLEHESAGGVVESLKIITEFKSTRIAKYAFEYAKKHGRKKVTAVHKANIMKLGDGLFLECCRRVSEQYPHIEFEGMIVDNCSMQMVSRPQQFDVMVLPNLYGNIIANIGAGLVGGPGVVPGVNVGDEFAVFESGTRNTGKNIAGKNIANPSAILLASAEMLAHMGLSEHGKLIKESIYKVMSQDQVHTPDIGGMATTVDVVQAVIKHIQSQAKI